MWISLGQLFRDGTLACTTWITEEPTTPCHFVFPDNHLTQSTDDVQAPVYQVTEGNGKDEPHRRCKNSLMVMDKIKNESDRRRIAASVLLDDFVSQESEVTVYLQTIKKYNR